MTPLPGPHARVAVQVSLTRGVDAKRLLSTAALIGLSCLSLGPRPATAQDHQFDCAILLCLAGGWPPSVPCGRERAEFTRRITPWPIEPPLQLWRCPMRAALDDPDPMQRLIRLAHMESAPQWSVVSESETLHLAQAVGLGAHIDVSDPASDFIRSIDMFDVQASQNYVRGNCMRSERVRHGTYDVSGQFRWHRASITTFPPAFRGAESVGTDCPRMSIRAVFVDWANQTGTYGFEQVNY